LIIFPTRVCSFLLMSSSPTALSCWPKICKDYKSKLHSWNIKHNEKKQLDM
jgi:hypothetical protein